VRRGEGEEEEEKVDWREWIGCGRGRVSGHWTVIPRSREALPRSEAQGRGSQARAGKTEFDDIPTQKLQTAHTSSPRKAARFRESGHQDACVHRICSNEGWSREEGGGSRGVGE